jgi:hypothetical protein
MEMLVLDTTVALLPVGGAAVLARLGLRSGDRPDDGKVRVRLSWPTPAESGGPDAPTGPYARIEVDNPAPGPVVASVAVDPVWRCTLGLRAPVSVSVPAPRRRALLPAGLRRQAGHVVVIDGQSETTFDVPLFGIGRASAVKVAVTLHQPAGRGQSTGRDRVHRFPLAVPSPPWNPSASEGRTLGAPTL